jgi:cobalamin biosynthesis Mg chelatase CobN
MNSFARLAALAALVSTTFALTIDTPPQSALVQCQPILLTWREGTPPYFPTVVAPGPGQVYKQFDQTDATSLTWVVDLPVGTNVNLGIKDSTGAQQYSATVQVSQGSSTSCLNASSSGNTGPTTGPSSGAPTGPSSTGAGSSTKSTAPSGSQSSSAASSSSSGKPDNGAMTSGASTLGVAAVMGLVGAALF